MASKSEAYNRLLNIANKGQQNRSVLKGSVANRELRNYNNRVTAYNKLIEEYNNNNLQKSTVDSVASKITSNYKTSDYGKNEMSNEFSAPNVLKGVMNQSSFDKMKNTNNKMQGVANQIVTNYRYTNEWNSQQRKKYTDELLDNAQNEYDTAKRNNNLARRKALLNMYNDKGEGAEYEKTRTELAQKKLAVKDIEQQAYTATQQENTAVLNNNKDIAKMIDLGAQVKLNKGIMTVDAENAQVADGQSPMAKRTLDAAQWRSYKKQLGKMGYSDDEIDSLVETRINQINGEIYEGNQALGEVAPVLAEGIRLVSAPKNEATNIIDTLKTMATKKVQPSYNSYMRAGLKKGVGNFAEKNGADLRGLLDSKNNNILKVNDKNELIVLGKNQGDVNRALYENIDQSATNIINSLLFGGGITGGIIAKGASEKVRQAVINTAFASGTMGEQLAEQLYNGEEASKAYKTALKDAAINWLSEMIGSPIEWANVNPTSALGKALVSGVGEGMEEIIGNAMDRTWDVVTNGKTNEMSQQYQEYINKGLSPKEATNRVLKDMVSDDIFAFMQAGAAGFVMGGVSAVSESAQKNTANKNIGAEIYSNQNEATLIEEAKKIDVDKIQKLAKKAEKAKSNSAKQKTAGQLLNAVQEHNETAYKKQAYDTVYEAVKQHSSSTKTATEVANAVVNGEKAKDTVSKQYVKEIKSNNSRLANRINDKLSALNYGANVRQMYAEGFTNQKSGSFEDYTKGLITPQQLYNEVSSVRTAEFENQDKEKQRVHSEWQKSLENRAEALVQEDSQEQIAKNNEQVLEDDTKEVLEKGKTAEYSDIKGISSVDNGVVLLNTNDGDTVALSNVDFGNNAEDKALFNLSSAFGNSANTFIANYKVNHQGENITDYYDRAQLAYNSGLKGIEYSKVFADDTFGLTRSEAKTFYEEGVKQRKVAERNNEFKEKVKKLGKGVHIMEDVNLTEAQKQEVDVLNKIVEGTSAKIVIAKSSNSAGIAKSNGYYDKNAIVIFSKEAGNAITAYAGHELTHYLQDNVSKEAYADYHDFVIEHLKSKGDNIYNGLVKSYAKAYGYDLDTQMQLIEEEMVADNGLAVFTDEKAMTKLAKNNRTLLEKIHDFFNQFIDKLKAIKAKLSKSSAVYATINQDIDYLEQSADKIRTMLDNVQSQAEKQNVNVQSKEKFSLDTNVEETKDLIAVHNLSEENLLKSLELGGLPMPSIAVMKAEQSDANSGYGSISLVFPKSTIDPSINSDNKLYGGDVWSPTYPKVEYKLNDRKLGNIYSRAIDALSGKKGAFNQSVGFAPQNIENEINSIGYEAFTKRYKEDYDTKQFYLSEKGYGMVQMLQNEVKTILPEQKQEMFDYFLNHMKNDFVSDVDLTGPDWLEKHGKQFDETYVDYLQTIPNVSKQQAEDMLSELRQYKKSLMRSEIIDYLENGATTITIEDDRKGTEQKIDGLISQKEYDDWFDDTFGNLIDKKGIRNNVEPYTASGNLRSFEKLHYEENLENVVRIMKNQENGENAFFGISGLWGVANKQFNSIDELKADSQRLKHLEQDEISKIKGDFSDRLTTIVEDLLKNKSYDNYFIAYDNTVETICEALRNTKTKVGLKNYLNKYSLNISDNNAEKLVNLISDISNMPADYFEAKPQRAIDFNEVYTAIIPDNSSQKLIDELSNANIDYDTYKNGDSNDRVAKLNSLNEVKFSKNTGEDYFSKLKPKKISQKEHWRINEAITSKWHNKGDVPEYILVPISNPELKIDKIFLVKYYGFDNFYVLKKLNVNSIQAQKIRSYYDDYRKNSKTSSQTISGNEFQFRGHNVNNGIFRDGEARTNISKQYGNSNSKNTSSDLHSNNSNGSYGIGRSSNNKQSRNTRLTLDDNIEDVNEAFLSAVKVLQNVHIDDIDLSSEVVNKAEKAAKHIQDEVKKSGYRTQKMTGKGSVRSIATELSEKYGDGKVTKSVVNRLAELYDYIANSEETDMGYINSQAKIIANELINSKNETLVNATDVVPEQLLTQLKKPVRIDEEAKKQLAEAYGSWSNAKRYISQFLTIDQNTTDTALTRYEDLQQEYDTYFDNEIGLVTDEKSAVDNLVELAERSQDIIVNSYENELAQTGYISEYDDKGNLIGQYESLEDFEIAVASDIFDDFFDVEQVKNAIDKLKTEQKEKIRALREQAKEEKAVIRQTYRESYNRKIASEKQKYNEKLNKRLAENKADYARRLENFKQYKKEVAQRGTERKETNLYKKRILRLKTRIEQQLLNPKGTNYIPRELVQSMADVCDVITGANMFYKNGNPRSGYETLLSLQDRYRKLKNDPDYDYSSEYNEDMEQRLSDLKDSLKGKQLSNLTNAEMQNVYEIVKGISTSLSQAKKLINSSIKISAHQSAVKLIEQQYNTRGKGKTPFGGLDYDVLNTMRYVNLISEGDKDGILNKLFDDINRGARKKDFLLMKWQKPFEELAKSNKEYKAFREKTVETPFLDIYGNKAQLTESQIVQLILSAKREQGRNHLKGGGFVAVNMDELFKNGKEDGKIKGEKVEQIGENLMQNISILAQNLSPYATKWLKTAEKFFNEEITSEVNETSFTLKGYKIANEGYYIPIVVDKNYTTSQLEGLVKDKTLENSGFTKEINKFASNRIVIEGIDSLVSRHIDNVADYASLAIPIRNFNKVWNGQTSSIYDGAVISELNKKYFGNRDRFSVKEAVEEKWGKKASKLITNAITDLQSPRDSNTSKFGNALMSLQINATFTGNISIVLKQAASYPTASAILSSSALAKGSKGFAYFTGTKKLQGLFDEIDEHTGAHYKRRIGMQTEELAAITRSSKGLTGKWLNSEFGALHPAKWIQAMDVQTTAALWIASKYEVEKMSKYKKGSAEYWEAVTDLYDSVIEETQPEYDVLHRAEIQKQTDFLSKTLSLFQTQPLQNSGLLYNSYREVMWAQRRYNADKSEANKIALNKAKKNAVKATWAITSAGITFATFSCIAAMVLHKPKKYKDDDGKVTAKSVLKRIGIESAETIAMGFLPIAGSYLIEMGSRVLSALESGTMSDYEYVENMGISALNELMTSTAEISTNLINVINGKEKLSEMKSVVFDYGKQVGQMLGIPVTNTENWIKSGIAYYHELVKRDYEMWEYNTQQPTAKEQVEKYVNSVNNGDNTAAEKSMNKWLEISKGKDKSDFESRVATYLASNNTDVIRAVQNRYSYNTDKYEAILDELVKKGYSRQVVNSAAQSAFNKVEIVAKAKFYGDEETYQEGFDELVQLGYDENTLKKHIASLQSDFSDDETETTVKGKYTVDELYKVWSEQGEESEAYKSMYNDILQTKIANGSDKEKAQESIKNSIKKKYKDNSPELQAAQTAYENGDMATYQRNVKAVIDEGKLDDESIITAARGTKPYKDTLWTATDYAKAIESGNKKQALNVYKDLCKANGSEKEERQYIRSSTTSYYRKKWLETETAQERKDILKHLRNAGFYTNSDIESLITKWEEARKDGKKE